MASSNHSRSTLAEQHLNHQETEFESLSKKLAEKELELATLENELSVFEKRYARTSGIFLAELDILEREIARELLRFDRELGNTDFRDLVNVKTRINDID